MGSRRLVKEVDDTPVTESRSEDDLFYAREVLRRVRHTLNAENWIARLEARVVELEKEVALLLEQRETVRAPEATDDPEWF